MRQLIILTRHSRTLDLDDGIIDVLQEMSRLPAATKAWRGIVSDAFGDTRFFNSTPETALKWKPLVRALMESDKQAFAELLGATVEALFASRIAHASLSNQGASRLQRLRTSSRAARQRLRCVWLISAG